MSKSADEETEAQRIGNKWVFIVSTFELRSSVLASGAFTQ